MTLNVRRKVAQPNTPALNASARKNLPLADAIRVLEAEAQQLFAALGGGSTRKAPARSRRRQGTRPKPSDGAGELGSEETSTEPDREQRHEYH